MRPSTGAHSSEPGAGSTPVRSPARSGRSHRTHGSLIAEWSAGSGGDLRSPSFRKPGRSHILQKSYRHAWIRRVISLLARATTSPLFAGPLRLVFLRGDVGAAALAQRHAADWHLSSRVVVSLGFPGRSERALGLQVLDCATRAPVVRNPENRWRHHGVRRDLDPIIVRFSDTAEIASYPPKRA
jgi:hypothetical protein